MLSETQSTSKALLPEALEELDVLIVGAGFAGLYQLDQLRELGYVVKVYEAAPRLGGVWYWNCYPGARVDSTGPLYQFSREELWKDWDYSELFPAWDEVRAYFDYVDTKLDLSADIRFNTRVTTARFDEDRHQWVVTTEGGSTTLARYLVLCTGIGSKPHLPDIVGLDDFTGSHYHTGLWPQDGVDLAGKRVGVIGTGATGVQVIQSSAAVAAHLTVFQRTPNLALPMGQRKLDEADKSALKRGMREKYAVRGKTFAGFEYDFVGPRSTELLPEEVLALYEDYWASGGFKMWLGNFFDVMTDDKANEVVYTFWRDKVRARINDPALAERLAPTVAPHPFGTRRPSLEQNYFEVYNQDNVRLVDVRESPIERVTQRGVLTADGEEHELDIIVLATGFDTVTGGMTAIDIRGTEGESLQDKWRRGVDAYLGTTTHGFPNMTFIYGPQSPSGFSNGPSCAELQGKEVVALIKYMQDTGHTRFESTEEADRTWRAHVDELAEATLLLRAHSWWTSDNIPGKVRQLINYPGGIPLFLEKWRDSKNAGYAGFKIV